MEEMCSAIYVQDTRHVLASLLSCALFLL